MRVEARDFGLKLFTGPNCKYISPLLAPLSLPPPFLSRVHCLSVGTPAPVRVGEMANGSSGAWRSSSQGRLCKSGSVEVSSPTFAPFIYEAGRPCEMCVRHHQSKRAVAVKAAKVKMKGSASWSGASSGSPKESQNPSLESMSISSSSDASLVQHSPSLVPFVADCTP